MNTICPNSMPKMRGQKTVHISVWFSVTEEELASLPGRVSFRKNLFFFFLWEAVLELLLLRLGWVGIQVLSTSDGLQPVISYTLNRPDPQYCCEWAAIEFYIHQSLIKFTNCSGFFLERPLLVFQADIAFPYLAPVKIWKIVRKRAEVKRSDG